MRYSDYKCFRFGFDSGVAFVSIDHPPINLLDEVLSQEFDKLGRELEADESVRVVVFAAVGKAIFGHPEVAVGLVPGGGATQRLPRLIGRGRALEVLLGCNDLSAELAERYGYINRALPADELTPFVEKLAHRIASFPAHAIAHAKAAVDTGAFSSMAEGLLVEAHESDLSVANEVTQARVTEVLNVGAETYEGEMEMDYLSRLSPIR
jgi:enoyl-CoA hydratase/carnithine racemase